MPPHSRCLLLRLLAVVALLSVINHGVRAASDEKLLGPGKKSGQHPLKGSIDNAKARAACPDYTAYARHRQCAVPVPRHVCCY